MRASIKVLIAAALLAMSGGVAYAQQATRIPVFPPHPYRAGHYPTADAYWDLPPYAALPPSYYRGRYFLTLRERDRYRYVPHIFSKAQAQHYE